MHKKIEKLLYVGLLFILACNSPVVPKNKGYVNVQFPEKKYQLFNESGYPYSFEYPVYAKINTDVKYYGVSKTKDFWMDIQFPQNNATINITYVPIQAKDLLLHINESYKYVSKHNTMANAINESVFTTSNGVYGRFFQIGGNVATPYQFFMTDSTHHFFRGSLYYNTTPNADSLAPVNEFIYKDLLHLVNTFRWK
jgi:gliding motility-associated lipoprotein GldD